MNPLPSKSERNEFDKAFSARLTGETEKKTGELRLADRQAQPAPFFNIAGQFGAKLVQYAKPGMSKKVLAAMADDTDPAVAIANIRKLLVGPTHKLHDAMFEEVITILEESDHEVQQALRALERKWATLSQITDELVAKSLDSKDQSREHAEFVQQELQKSAASQQEMLSEMFLVIDGKIDELTKQVDQKVEALAQKIETDMREAAESQERRLQELEAKYLERNKVELENLENRLVRLERKSSTSTDDLNEVFAGGLTSIADRLKALRDNQAN
ncbi:MAG TPA: hypothetical protein VM144_14815 [Aestuariivirga sp.]|nr:hypothetical protein [Aestuariivirga sp.]